MRHVHHGHWALHVYALNAHLRIFLDLEPPIRFYITWLSTNRMEVFMSTKWYKNISFISLHLLMSIFVTFIPLFVFRLSSNLVTIMAKFNHNNKRFILETLLRQLCSDPICICLKHVKEFTNSATVRIVHNILLTKYTITKQQMAGAPGASIYLDIAVKLWIATGLNLSNLSRTP